MSTHGLYLQYNLEDGKIINLGLNIQPFAKNLRYRASYLDMEVE